MLRLRRGEFSKVDFFESVKAFVGSGIRPTPMLFHHELLLATEKNPGESYGFENTYEFVGSMARGEGCITKNFKNSLIGEVKGSNLHTGECHYSWFTGNAGSGKIGRRGVFFGGRSARDSCSLRSGGAAYAPSAAFASIGGGFRCTITQP